MVPTCRALDYTYSEVYILCQLKLRLHSSPGASYSFRALWNCVTLLSNVYRMEIHPYHTAPSQNNARTQRVSSLIIIYYRKQAKVFALCTRNANTTACTQRVHWFFVLFFHRSVVLIPHPSAPCVAHFSIFSFNLFLCIYFRFNVESHMWDASSYWRHCLGLVSRIHNGGTSTYDIFGDVIRSRSR